MIRKQNSSSNPTDFPKSAKNFYEKALFQETTFKTPTYEFYTKIPNRMKISNEQFHLCKAEISLKVYKNFFI